MMLYTKYESSRPCSFRQEDFLKLHFENLFFDHFVLRWAKKDGVWLEQIDGASLAAEEKHFLMFIAAK